MFRRILILTAVVLFFSACKAQAVVIHCSWVGCENGLWSDPSRWSCGTVPDNNAGDTFVVTIDASSCSDDVEVGLQQSRTIDQLDCYGEVGIEGWTPFWVQLSLEHPNGLTNHGHLEIGGEAHQMEINGNVTNTTGAMLELGGVEINANLYNLAGATIEVEYENDVDGDFQNEGTFTIIPASDLLCSNEFHNIGVVNLYDAECSGDELFHNSSTGTLSGSGTVWSERLIQNEGKLCASAGPLLLFSEGSVTNTGTLKNDVGGTLHIQASVADVNNQGRIEINTVGAVTFNGNLNNGPNATIQLFGGTLAAQTITQAADANFAGFGGITGDLVIEPNGVIQLTGPTNIVGNVTIDPNATLEISDGTTLITGHTACNNGTIHMIGGRIICQGGLTNNNCNIIWEPGIYTNIADFNLDGTVNFEDFADFANTWLWRADWFAP